MHWGRIYFDGENHGAHRQSRIGVTAIDARGPQLEVVFANFTGEFDCYLVRALLPNQVRDHRSSIGEVSRRGLYRIRPVLPANRIAHYESSGIAAESNDEEALDLVIGALALIDPRGDPMRLVVESLKSLSRLTRPARSNEISCGTWLGDSRTSEFSRILVLGWGAVPGETSRNH